jgi:hypothetical protein
LKDFNSRSGPSWAPRKNSSNYKRLSQPMNVFLKSQGPDPQRFYLRRR